MQNLEPQAQGRQNSSGQRLRAEGEDETSVVILAPLEGQLWKVILIGKQRESIMWTYGNNALEL